MVAHSIDIDDRPQHLFIYGTEKYGGGSGAGGGGGGGVDLKYAAILLMVEPSLIHVERPR